MAPGQRPDNAVAWFLDRQVEDGRGAHTAFIDEARSLTYAQLQQATHRFAAGLRAAGIGPEQRVALLLHDTVDFPIAFWGSLRAGAVPVPVNTLLPADILHYILADSRAAALVVAEPLLAAVAPLLADLPALRLTLVAARAAAAADAQPADAKPADAKPADAKPAGATRSEARGAVAGADEAAGPGVSGRPLAAFLAAAPPQAQTWPAPGDEVAFWLYSSGSTGNPKGTRHVHASLRATAQTYGAQVLGITPEDVMFSAAKLFFAYGLGNSMTFPMSVGATAVLLPHRPTPEAVLALMRAHRPTLFAGVPTLFAALLAQPDLPPGAGSDRLRRCISAGEALPAQIGQAWRRRVGVDILDGIGSTEMLHIFLSNSEGALRYGTSGRAVPGYELRIEGEDGRAAPDGEIGELLVRGPSAADGYWNQRARSRHTFAGEWTRTGDKYRRDADGFYVYQGRADDMFKVSGIWVSPFEVEAALIAHDAVLEAAVVGHEDSDGLTKPKAFVVLKSAGEASAALLSELRQFVKDRAGPWKYPRWIEVVEELPKTATGKIQRFRLRDGR
jgi:4-hydroxybenzoate-CoA ligase